MKLVVIDTCEISKDFFLRNKNVSALQDWCRSLDFTIVFPEIVISEMVRHYRRELKENLKSANDFLRLLKEGTHQRYTERDIDFAVAKYEKNLRVKAMAIGKIAKLPPSSSSLLDRSYRTSKKPYNDQVNGFADVYLWATVLNLAKEHEVHFISSNTREFSDGERGLHLELKADISELNIPEGRIQFYPGLSAFSNAIVQPIQDRRKQLDAYATEIASGCFRGASLLQWILDNYEHDMSDPGLVDFDFSLPECLDTICFEGLQEVSGFWNIRVGDLNPGMLLVEADASLSLVFSGDCWEVDVTSEMTYQEYGILEHGCDVVRAYVTRTCIAEVCLLIDEVSGAVQHANVSGTRSCVS